MALDHLVALLVGRRRELDEPGLQALRGEARVESGDEVALVAGRVLAGANRDTLMIALL
jgi:hypothetical protein